MTGVGLIGLGRVGRRLFRLLAERAEFRLAAVCERNPAGRPPAELAANLAYLLAQDTAAGPWHGAIGAEGGALTLGGRALPLLLDIPPQEVDWAGLGVDLLVEASGDPAALAAVAPLAGRAVRKVVITRSDPAASVTLVRGVNLAAYDPARHHLISCSTCTANALAPVLLVLDRAFGVRRVTATTIHPALSGDGLLDAPRAEAAAGRSGMTVRPVASQLGHTIEELLPRLAGRVQAMSFRVPTLAVNALLAEVLLQEPAPGRARVVEVLEEAERGELAGVLALERGFLGLPRVAADFAGHPASAVVDLNWLTLNGPLLRLLIWHDNEHAYCLRVVETLALLLPLATGVLPSAR